MKSLSCIFVFICSLLVTNTIRARIIHVPTDSSTIQAGINGAVNGDTVLVSRGHYYERINFLGKAILVASDFIFDNDTVTIDSTIIDGENSGSVVIFSWGADTTSIIQGFTITNGHATEGGGILCEVESSPSIKNNIITGNSATYGGGGISCVMLSSPIIRDNVIDSNSVSQGTGGGILCRDISSPMIGGNTITENSTSYDGGGICCMDYGSSPIISNNLISRNIAGYGGGGIYCLFASPTIYINEISHNVANYDGGGISCFDEPSPIIQNNTVKYNFAGSTGGGICCSDFSLPTLNNNIITKNSASNKGSGIFCGYRAKPIISNNIISWNMNSYAIACTTESYPAIYHNNIWNNTDGDFHNCPEGVGDTIWRTNFNNTPCDSFYNIIRDPIFADTISFELLCNSPCIDAGDPTIDISPDSGGCRIDMGAHEYPYTLGDANSDGVIIPLKSRTNAVNVGDIVFMVNYLYQVGPPPCPYHAGDTNCDGMVDIADVICLINYLFRWGDLPCQVGNLTKILESNP